MLRISVAKWIEGRGGVGIWDKKTIFLLKSESSIAMENQKKNFFLPEWFFYHVRVSAFTVYVLYPCSYCERWSSWSSQFGCDTGSGVCQARSQSCIPSRVSSENTTTCENRVETVGNRFLTVFLCLYVGISVLWEKGWSGWYSHVPAAQGSAGCQYPWRQR